MHADFHFTIGNTHKICQDYAKAGNDEGGVGSAYAVLSDGCSSSPDTDIGARHMVLAGTENLLYEYGNEVDWAHVAQRAQAAALHSRLLSAACIDATLLSLRQCEECLYEGFRLTDKHILAALAGDGVLAARRRDGTLQYWVVRCEPGEGGVAPPYPSYLLDPERLRRYISAGHGVTTLSEFLDGELVGAIRKSVHPEDFGWKVILTAAEYDFVAVLSDGVESFYTKNSSGRVTHIPLPEVLRELLAIKNGKGQFVTRRCQRFFRSFCPQNGWVNTDDFSMAAIWCKEG